MALTTARTRQAALGHGAAARRSAAGRLLGRDWLLAYLLLLPVMLVLVGLVAYPFATAVRFSLQHVQLGGDSTFVGLRNYATLLAGAERERFFNSVRVTALYTLTALMAKFVIGMACALILSSAIRGRNVWRALFFLPWAVPQVVSAFAWKWIYDASRGVLNMQLEHYGLIKTPILWLADIHLTLWAVVAAVIWQGAPFWILTFLAGLQAIPHELYEAAEIDGATTAQGFYYITLPSMRNVILVTLMLSGIWTANSVQYVYVLTGGGPANATETFPMLALSWGIRANDIAMGATVPLLFLPVFAICIYVLSRRMLQEA